MSILPAVSISLERGVDCTLSQRGVIANLRLIGLSVTLVDELVCTEPVLIVL
jgi:hypothetical protein